LDGHFFWHIQIKLKTMITESTARQLIIEAEPELSIASANEVTISKLVYRFADKVRAEIVEGEFTRLQKDFEIAEQLLKDGNAMVKLAMSNVFVYTLSHILSLRMAFPFSMKAFAMLPECLKQEYYRQLNASTRP
jgi:hypothetical protein